MLSVWRMLHPKPHGPKPAIAMQTVKARCSKSRELEGASCQEFKTCASPEQHDILERSSRVKAKLDDDGYISIREVARRSSMSEKSIRNFIRNDALPHYRNSKSGNIWLRWSEFVEWMGRRRIELKQDGDLLSILRDMNARGNR